MRFPLVTENSPFYLFCHGMGKSLTVTNEIDKIISTLKDGLGAF